jgi:hypothetical protein
MAASWVHVLVLQFCQTERYASPARTEESLAIIWQQ